MAFIISKNNYFYQDALIKQQLKNLDEIYLINYNAQCKLKYFQLLEYKKYIKSKSELLKQVEIKTFLNIISYHHYLTKEQKEFFKKYKIISLDELIKSNCNKKVNVNIDFKDYLKVFSNKNLFKIFNIILKNNKIENDYNEFMKIKITVENSFKALSLSYNPTKKQKEYLNELNNEM